MDLGREWREAERTFAAGRDVAGFAALAAVAVRAGRRPEAFAEAGVVDELLAALAAAPDRRVLAHALELVLPLEILGGAPASTPDPWADSPRRVPAPDHPFDRETGRPLWVRLRPTGEVLVLAPDGTSWEGAAPLDEDRLRREGHGLDLLEGAWGDARSLAWYRVAEYAQALTDAWRADDTLAPSWELTLPRHGGQRHTFPAASRRLVLRRARRKRPAPARLERGAVYTGINGAGFRTALGFHPGGRLAFFEVPKEFRRLEYESLLPGGSPQGVGRWEQDGRRWRGEVTTPSRAREYQGFVGDDGAVNLVCTSRITQHRSANALRKKRLG